MTIRLHVENATKTVGSKERRRIVWKGINFDVHSGERVCLSGASGCGKSTLLHCIGLLEPLDAGRIVIDGQDATTMSARGRRRLRRTAMGYMFQDYALIDNETVEHNVRLAAPPRQQSLPVEEALHRVGLAGRGSDRVHELSGGEQQRVAVARLLVRRPPLVLADEPTASLDRENATAILNQLLELAENGSGVLLVSHDPWVIQQCDRTVRLDAHKTAHP